VLKETVGSFYFIETRLNPISISANRNKSSGFMMYIALELYLEKMQRHSLVSSFTLHPRIQAL
jgi:hypothetical protein